MPTKYALMGATGATGRAILRHLQSNPPQDLTLNIYVRNKSKLLNSFPDLEAKSPFPVQIYEGSNTDVDLLQECLKDAQVIFMCIAVNVAQKGETLFSDTAQAVSGALSKLKNSQQNAFTTPSILILRAVPLNPNFTREAANMGERFLFYVLGDLYGGMAEANKLYEAKAKENPGLFNIIYVDPPAIHDEDGTTPTGYRLYLEPPPKGGAENMGHEVSYADLGVSFCEIAERRSEFAGKGIVVIGTGEMNRTWGRNVAYLWQNLRPKIIGF